MDVARHSEPAFPETGRFEVGEVLGRGAFGVVYAVVDRRQGTPLAAKLLHHDHPRALARFKNEFRAFADLHHPNLVRLYELHADGDRWFFTMERLDGCDPLTWLGGAGAVAPTLTETASDLDAGSVAPAFAVADGASSDVDWDAMRAVFAQVAAGLHVLHDAGLVHRDLKPSNISVDEDGRAKLLDFGLSEPMARTGSGRVAGTLPYMAPELLEGGQPGPASDWYAMGVTLHQAMTGSLPRRSQSGIESQELRGPEHPLRTTLWALCRSLLSSDPGTRPSGDAVVRRLGAADGPTPVWTKDAPTSLVGRDHEFERLRARLRMSRDAGSQVVFVYGASGVGKSALGRAFCDAAAEEGALLLSARCFQQEVAPLKALGGIVDALAQAMLDDVTLTEASGAVLSERGAVLGDVFPVLRASPAVGAAVDGSRPSDGQEVRRQAFEGLCELVSTICTLRPVVILVDDLQWGDAESADVVASMVRAAPSAGVLLVATCREEERDASAFLARWEVQQPLLGREESVESIVLGPLSASEAAELARLRLSRSPGVAVDTDRIAQESGGNPFLVEELARQAHRVQRGSASLWMGLAEALRARVDSLPSDARRVLELVAIAGRPVEEGTLGDASGLGPRTFAALDALRAAHLVRMREQAAETYHDRIRATLLEVLGEERHRDGHRRLATALEARVPTDHERVSRHFEAAGETRKAGDHALLAADAAEETLAFERAAALLASVLSSLAEDDPRRDGVLRRRADALIHCGKGAEAAPILQALAGESGRHDDLRRAAEQWMISGHLDRGIAALQDVLRRDGLRWPERPGATMAAVFRDLSLVAVQRGRPKPAPYDARRVSQVDTCWTGVRGLSSVDHVRGLYFAVHGMRLALALGEPRRIAKIGMFFAAQLRAMDLPGGVALFERYGAQAQASDDPELHAYVDYLEGYVQLQRGEATAAGAAFETAIERFESDCTGVGWEVSVAMSMFCETLSERGAMRKLADVARDALHRAESLSDTHAAHGAHLFLGLSALAEDRPERARKHYVEIPEAGGFHYTHFVSTLSQCLIDLYQAKEARAWDRMQALVPKLERSGLGRSPFVKCKLLSRKGACAVAMLASSTDRTSRASKRIRKEVDRSVAGLRKLDRRDARAEATQLRAALAALEGDSDRARTLLEEAAEHFAALGLELREELCQLRLQQLEGPSSAAFDAIAARGVRNPARWAAAHTPGFEFGSDVGGGGDERRP